MLSPLSYTLKFLGRLAHSSRPTALAGRFRENVAARRSCNGKGRAKLISGQLGKFVSICNTVVLRHARV
jgi:hypothetical protein